MTKSIKEQAPSMPGTDTNVGGKHRILQNKKEKNQMNNFKKKITGIASLILKVSFIIAGVALWKMPVVHIIVDIPLYQVVGSVILAFLIYLELYAYFVSAPAKKTGKKTEEPKSALDGLTVGFEEL